MELVVADFGDVKAFQNSTGEYLPIAEWSGVVFNISGNVLEIHWGFQIVRFPANSNIDMESLPHTVERLDISQNTLEGHADFGIFSETSSF